MLHEIEVKTNINKCFILGNNARICFIRLGHIYSKLILNRLYLLLFQFD